MTTSLLTAVLLGLGVGVGLLLSWAPALWPAPEPSDAAKRSTVRDRLAQAGLARVTPSTFATVCLVLGAATAAATQATLGVAALSLAAGLVAASAPVLAVGSRARTRRRATRAIWPDVVDQLVSAVRAGVPLPDAVSGLALTGPEATRAAFEQFADSYRATTQFGVAVDRVKAVLADPVADRILETLRMAREVGGSELTAVLRGLSAHLRQEAAIRSEVEARQSWVVNAARLGVASPWLVLILLSTRPEAAHAYNSPAGGALVIAGLVISVVAYRVMVRVGRLPEEPRWFA